MFLRGSSMIGFDLMGIDQINQDSGATVGDPCNRVGKWLMWLQLGDSNRSKERSKVIDNDMIKIWWFSFENEWYLITFNKATWNTKTFIRKSESNCTIKLW